MYVLNISSCNVCIKFANLVLRCIDLVWFPDDDLLRIETCRDGHFNIITQISKEGFCAFCWFGVVKLSWRMRGIKNIILSKPVVSGASWQTCLLWWQIWQEKRKFCQPCVWWIWKCITQNLVINCSCQPMPENMRAHQRTSHHVDPQFYWKSILVTPQNYLSELTSTHVCWELDFIAPLCVQPA